MPGLAPHDPAEVALGPLAKLPPLRRALTSARAQTARHRIHWNELAGRDGELVYLALGDSAAVGVGVDDVADGYVSILTARLAESSGRTIRAINLGMSGATAATVLSEQVPLLADLPRPDVCTLVVGGNDVFWTRRFRIADFADPLREIARHLPAGSTLGLVPSFTHWPYEPRVRAANIAVRAVAEQLGLRVADIYSPTRALGAGRRKYATLAADRFHPNAAGYRIWADALWPPVSEQLAERLGRAG